ncbi:MULTISPECIES: hypothetical protein [Protofrankia]|uniref:PE-PGRS family protein n=1 Tax=Protofrankia coriariae TaxID=1562887 RepID=A0ABR5F1B5_9ACTN|nr:MULTISPECIES: hypothetical protein [Protofrankia]KLL10496.1 hypothetical protein FrCorBMG51_17640 [Protofrankia coriariae]ONH34102.1 hypothetical protein BL254_18125 [Protofrankia sp. BMG5.30]
MAQQQQQQQIEQELRQNWQQIRYRLLDEFGQVGTADLDAARDVNDLVQRIADKTHHSERYVETRLQELVGVGASGQRGQQQGGFGQQQGQQGQQGQRFGR